MNWLISFARSVPVAVAAVCRSAQSLSLMRTERCCVPGWFGITPSVRTGFTFITSVDGVRAPTLRCGVRTPQLEGESPS